MNESGQYLLADGLNFYNQNKEQFLHEHTNRHLLIKVSELIGSFPTKELAVGEGVRLFGMESFLVRKSGMDTPTITVPILALGLPYQS